MTIKFYYDNNFIALIPAININFHFPQIEFEWLIFGLYFDFGEKKCKKQFDEIIDRFKKTY